MGEGCRADLPSAAVLHTTRLPAPAESSQDLLEFFMEASITQPQLVKSLAFGDQCPASLPSLGGWGGGWKAEFQPSNHRIGFLATSPPPQLSHSHFITMNSGVVERSLL